MTPPDYSQLLVNPLVHQELRVVWKSHSQFLWGRITRPRPPLLHVPSTSSLTSPSLHHPSAPPALHPTPISASHWPLPPLPSVLRTLSENPQPPTPLGPPSPQLDHSAIIACLPPPPPALWAGTMSDSSCPFQSVRPGTGVLPTGSRASSGDGKTGHHSPHPRWHLFLRCYIHDARPSVGLGQGSAWAQDKVQYVQD